MRVDVFELLLARQVGNCPAGTTWYSCNTNNYRGCCSTDPCSNDPTDPCPDANDDGTTTSPSPKSTQSPTKGTPTPTAGKTTSTSTDSSSSSSTTSTTTASENTGTTLVTSVVSTTDSTGGPSSATQVVPVPAPTSTPQADSHQSSQLSDSTIAGIGVGSTLAIIGLGFLLSLMLRRRRTSKRASSTHHSTNSEDKASFIDQTQSSSQRRGNDTADPVFGPFGGRASSPNKRSGKQDEAWPLRNGEPHEDEAGPAQLDSRPVYVELDSAATERAPSTAAMPSPPSSKPSPASPTFHPSPLTPGFPGTQLTIQDQLNRRFHGDYQRDSAHLAPGTPRATLNATFTERQNGEHVTSWSSGL